MRSIKQLIRSSAAIALSALIATAAAGEDTASDFSLLDLEELLSVPAVPVDVAGSHIHRKGEWMVGYKFMMMDMDGNRSGGTRVSTASVLDSFMVAPTRMTMEMHMVEFMYGLTDRITLMAMVPYHKKEMDHVTRTGIKFATATQGVGDVGLMSHIVLARRGSSWWIFTPGLTLPTGSIEERGATPAGANSKLPYPMQLGTGSAGLSSVLNYIRIWDDWSAGFHAKATTSLGRNDNDYEVGNRYDLSSFVSYRISPRFGVSLEVGSHRAQNYSGADPELNPRMVPTADPRLRGGDRVDAAVSLNYFVSNGQLAGNRVLFRFGSPVNESLDGPQLETDSNATVSWQWTF